MARLQPWFKKKIKKKICSTDDPKIKVHLTDLPVGFGYKGKHTIRIISHIHTNTARHVYASFPWGKVPSWGGLKNTNMVLKACL